MDNQFSECIGCYQRSESICTAYLVLGFLQHVLEDLCVTLSLGFRLGISSRHVTRGVKVATTTVSKSNNVTAGRWLQYRMLTAYQC